jgi:hypothetical protein
MRLKGLFGALCSLRNKHLLFEELTRLPVMSLGVRRSLSVSTLFAFRILTTVRDV